MSRYTVTTYQPMNSALYRARLHGPAVPLVETRHTIEAPDALGAVRAFPAHCAGPSWDSDPYATTTREGWRHDAHSQHDPRVGTVGVYAVLAG